MSNYEISANETIEFYLQTTHRGRFYLINREQPIVAIAVDNNDDETMLIFVATSRYDHYIHIFDMAAGNRLTHAICEQLDFGALFDTDPQEALNKYLISQGVFNDGEIQENDDSIILSTNFITDEDEGN